MVLMDMGAGCCFLYEYLGTVSELTPELTVLQAHGGVEGILESQLSQEE